MTISIIGSNFVSLALALRFAKNGAEVTIFEKEQVDWGGAWKLRDIFHWKRMEVAWHVILFEDKTLPAFKEFFGYFGETLNIIEGKQHPLDDSFFVPNHLTPSSGVNNFIQKILIPNY